MWLPKQQATRKVKLGDGGHGNEHIFSLYLQADKRVHIQLMFI